MSEFNPETPESPYPTDVENAAWKDGYKAKVRGFSKEDNPCTAADTCVAWSFGHEAAPEPTVVPLDITEVDWTAPGIHIGAYLRDSQRAGILPTFKEYGLPEGTEKPDWADNNAQANMIPLPIETVNALAYWAIRSGHVSIDLPCPPYQFENEGASLTISAGVFKKSGTKAEWQAVLKRMQEEVNDMPDGLNVDDVNVTLDVVQRATVRSTATVDASTLLAYADQYVDDVWLGTLDELDDALAEAIEQIDVSELDIDDYNMETEIDDHEEADIQASDLTYDLEQVIEL